MYGRRRKSPFSMGNFSLFQVRIELLVWLLGTVMADAVGKVHNRVALDVCFWKPLQIIRTELLRFYKPQITRNLLGRLSVFNKAAE